MKSTIKVVAERPRTRRPRLGDLGEHENTTYGLSCCVESPGNLRNKLSVPENRYPRSKIRDTCLLVCWAPSEAVSRGICTSAQAPVSRIPRCPAVAQRRGRSCWKFVRGWILHVSRPLPFFFVLFFKITSRAEAPALPSKTSNKIVFGDAAGLMASPRGK